MLIKWNLMLVISGATDRGDFVGAYYNQLSNLVRSQ